MSVSMSNLTSIYLVFVPKKSYIELNTEIIFFILYKSYMQTNEKLEKKKK